MKKLLTIMFVVLMMSLVSCDDTLKYKDSHPELHVIATNSLLGVFGHESNEILVLESDEYGRTMFAFKGGSSNDMVLAVLIAQKTTKTNSYFYDNINLKLCEIDDSYHYIAISSEMVSKFFANEQLEQLKEQNDWNKVINEQKLFKVPITRKKSVNVSTPNQRKAFEKVSGDYHRSYSIPLTTDKNGKTIYYMRGMKYDNHKEENVFTKSYLFMFDKDGNVNESTGIAELVDLWDYQKQLIEFKELNNWSFYVNS